jgi:hypothetical protein
VVLPVTRFDCPEKLGALADDCPAKKKPLERGWKMAFLDGRRS